MGSHGLQYNYQTFLELRYCLIHYNKYNQILNLETLVAYFGAPKIRFPIATDISHSVNFSSFHTRSGADVPVLFTTPKSLSLGYIKTPVQGHQHLLGLKKK